VFQKHMHTFRRKNLIFLMHKLLLIMQSFHIYLNCVKLLKFLIYYIAKYKGRHFLASKLYIFIIIIKKRKKLLTFRSHIYVFIYFNDKNNIKIKLMICLVENKFLNRFSTKIISTNMKNFIKKSIIKSNKKQSEDLI